MPDGPENTALLVAFARLEGKVDLTLAELVVLKATDADHENRLRSIEARPIPDAETDKRVRALEDRRTISPAQLWAGLVGVTGVIGTVLLIVNGVIDVVTP